MGPRLRLRGVPGSADTGPSPAGTAQPAGYSWRIQTGSGAGMRLQPGQPQDRPWSLWKRDKRQQVPRGVGNQAGAEIRMGEGAPKGLHSIKASLNGGFCFLICMDSIKTSKVGKTHP